MTWTLLHDLFACRPTPFTNAAVIKNARELPNNITSVDDRGYTPLHIAVSANNTILLDAIKALVDVYPSAVMAKASALCVGKMFS
jgi:ankyrin repeat protein